MNRTTAEEAVSVIQSDNRVFIQSVAAAPRLLIEAMTARAPELRNVELVHLHTEGPAPYAAPEMRDTGAALLRRLRRAAVKSRSTVSSCAAQVAASSSGWLRPAG